MSCPEVTEEMMQRAHRACENRDWSKPEHDHLRAVIAAALEVPAPPEIQVSDEMITAGRSAYKFAMWRSLCFAATIEETLANIYRVMANLDPARQTPEPK